MRKADLLVSLGERLTDSVSQSYSFPTAPDPQLPLVHVWPDANEIGRVFRPDLGIAAEPADVIRALLRRGAPADAAKRRGWVAGLNGIHQGLMAPNWDSMADGVNFAAVCIEIGKHMAPDAAVTSDAGNFSSFIHRYIGFRPGQNFLSSVVGAMGAGVPMAVAAAIRRPGKQSIGFVGDGGALMSGNEIATAMQYGGDADHHHLRQQALRHHRHAPRGALPQPPLRIRGEADQPRLRRLGPRLRCGRHHHLHRGRGRGGHRPRLRRARQAGGGACAYLAPSR